MIDEARARGDDVPAGRFLPVTTDEDRWLRDRAGTKPIILKPTDEGDVEGHGMGGATVLLRAYEDDDDTEGHAIAVRFPTRDDADAFRRKLVLAGALSATIAIGAAGAVGLASLTDTPATGNAVVAGAADTNRDIGIMDRAGTSVATAATTGSVAGSAVSDADRDLGLADRAGTATSDDRAPDIRRSTGPTPE